MAKSNGYLRARSAVSVESAPGNHMTLEYGEVVSKRDLAQHVVDRFEDGDPWLANLFEEASEEDYTGVPARGAFEDAHTRQLKAVEEDAKERSTQPIEERLGAADPARIGLMIGDEDRTLPTSGADLETDVKFADGTADTSEAVDAAKGEAEDRTDEGGKLEAAPKKSRRGKKAADKAEEPAAAGDDAKTDDAAKTDES